MLPTYRVQVRRRIETRDEASESLYVFRDVELPFVPLPGLKVEDFDGECFRFGPEVLWREGQHRFIVYVDPNEDLLNGAGRSVDEILSAEEARGWNRNRRTVDRIAA